MESLTDKEVKESLKKNKEKLTLRFNMCLVLMKDIEHVVKNTMNTWKNAYLLQKLSDFPINLNDVDDDNNEEKYGEENDEEATHFDNIDDEEEHKQEAIEEETQYIEEIDPIKIAIAVIASLPHSPRKILTTSSKKIASVGLIVATTTSPCMQSIFAPV